ncbi:MAG: LysR family transcriptional regulator, partial [bacterium]|nr:LysR family transcriptional regulator [bacterium]
SLDVKLLDRGTRPLKLTDAGRLYYQFCRDVLRRRQEFDAELDQMKRRVEGSVRVASIYSIGLSEMSRMESRFREAHPDAELAVEYLRPEKVYETVASDGADLGLLSYPEPSKEIKVVHWRDEVMVVAAPPDHPLAVNTFLSVKQLERQPYVGFDDDLPIARNLRRFFREHGVKVSVALHFDNVFLIKEAVALGSGISILPEQVISDEIAQERLIGIPLESPGLCRPVGIVHHRKKKFNRATRAFLGMLEREATP